MAAQLGGCVADTASRELRPTANKTAAQTAPTIVFLFDILSSTDRYAARFL
jgi:hypothetical protein